MVFGGNFTALNLYKMRMAKYQGTEHLRNNPNKVG